LEIVSAAQPRIHLRQGTFDEAPYGTAPVGAVSRSWTIPSAVSDYSQNLLVEDLNQLLRHLGLGPVHLGGCSMGANVARDFAIAHPEMTRSLILVGAGAGSLNRKQFLQDEEAMTAGLERNGIASLVHHFEIVPNRASFSVRWQQLP